MQKPVEQSRVSDFLIWDNRPFYPTNLEVPIDIDANYLEVEFKLSIAYQLLSPLLHPIMHVEPDDQLYVSGKDSYFLRSKYLKESQGKKEPAQNHFSITYNFSELPHFVIVSGAKSNNPSISQDSLQVRIKERGALDPLADYGYNPNSGEIKTIRLYLQQFDKELSQFGKLKNVIIDVTAARLRKPNEAPLADANTKETVELPVLGQSLNSPRITFFFTEQKNIGILRINLNGVAKEYEFPLSLKVSEGTAFEQFITEESDWASTQVLEKLTLFTS